MPSPLTYPLGHTALLGVARLHLLFYIPFGALGRSIFLRQTDPLPKFVAIRIGDAKIGIRRAILCTAGPDAFWCFLGFFTKLRCEYELGGFTLVLWWHWVVREGRL
jgi:hypothetical protein